MDEVNKHHENVCDYITKYWKDQQPILEDYKDPFFPPDIRSVLAMDEDFNYIDENGEETSKTIESECIVWKRVGKIMTDYNVFVDKIEASDIKQGNVGNCYFLSVLAAFTSSKQRFIHSLFKTKEKNEEGIYEMVLFVDGQWQIVFVDDYFPIDKRTGEFFFSKPNGNELWVILLEKAFAKINRGYINMNSGFVSDPIYVISGFPTETYFNNQISDYEIFNKIVEAEKSNSLICTSTISDETIRNKGLVNSHSYTIINTIDDYKNSNKNDPVQLIKLRNPWSFFEWNGAWGDNSEEWTTYLKLKYDIVAKDDGIFHMCLKDYKEYFNYFNISHILYGSFVKCYIINYTKFPNVFNFKLEQDSKVCFSIIKKHWRYNQRNLKFKSRPLSFIMVKYKNKKEILRIDGQYRVYENVEYIEELQAGKYFLFVLCPLEYYAYDNDTPNQPIQYVFRICTKSKFESKFAGSDENYSLLHFLIVNNVKFDYQHLIDNCKSYFTMPFKILEWSGLKCFVIINKDGYLKAKVHCKSIEKIMKFPIYEFESAPLKIAPLEGIAIIYQYGDVQSEIKCNLDFDIEVCGAVKTKEKINRENTLNPNSFDKMNTSNLNTSTTSKSYYRGMTGEYEERKKLKIKSQKGLYGKQLTHKNNTKNLENLREEEYYRSKIDDDDYDDYYDDHPHLNIFFYPNYNFDNAESFTYNVINEDEVNIVPTYKNIYTGRDFVITDLDELRKKFAKQLKRLDEYQTSVFADSSEDMLSLNSRKEMQENIKNSSGLSWASGKIKDGTYVGQIEQSTNRPQGIGIFILNTKDIYLGYWDNGYLEGYGKVFNKLDKPVYEGNFVEDVKYGIGRFYLKNNEKYEGQFSNNAFNGSGIYIFKDGRIWIGYFVGNGKERAGVQIYPDKRLEIVTYFNNCMSGANNIDNSLKQKFLENNDKVITKIESIASVTKQNDILIERNIQIEKERKENPMDNIELIEDVDEKNRLLKLKKLKDLQPFMFEIVMKHKSDEHKLELIYLRDDERNAFYLGQINEDNAYEENGGLMLDKRYCITCCKFIENKEESINRDKNDIDNKSENNEDKDQDNNRQVSKKSKMGTIRKTIDKKSSVNLSQANLKNLSKNFNNFNSRKSSRIVGGRRGSSKNPDEINKFNKNLYSNKDQIDELIDEENEDECENKHIKIKYVFGFFINDKIVGRVFLYDDKEKLIYKGSAIEEGLIPHGKGQKFFLNGDIYLGDFVNGKMHGEGSLTYTSGDTLVGKFENDVPSGDGVIYEKDNPIPYTISFKNGVKVIAKQVSKPFIEKHTNALNILYQKFPIIISVLITYFPPHSDNSSLSYQHIILEDNIQYFGQVNEKGELKGRGVMVLDTEIDEPYIEKYYVGKRYIIIYYLILLFIRIFF